MQYRKLDWGVYRTTENVNKRLIEILEPGVYAGYYVQETGPASMNLNIVKRNDNFQALITSEGKTVVETDDLPSAVTIPAADATNPRIDLVVAISQHTPAGDPQVYQVTEGTPAPSPVSPSAPPYSTVLAQVYVAAGVTSITQSDISEQANEVGQFPVTMSEDGTVEGKVNRIDIGQNLNLTVSNGVGTISLDAGYGTTYVQDDDPSTPAGGSNDMVEGDRWLDTSGGAGLIVMWVAGSSWSAGDPTDWVKWEREQHAPEHEAGGGDEVDPLQMINVGNSSGEVPVSNGNLNTNLNADLLDGQHASEFASSSDYVNHDHSPGDPTQVDHGDLLSVNEDNHHNRQHALNSSLDHTGDLDYSQLDSLVDISGSGSPNMISGAQHEHTGVDGSTKINHSNLLGLTENNHHNRQHALNSLSDHTGDLDYSQIDAIVDTSGGGGSSQISRADHQHTGSDGSSQVSHANLTGITASQHHTAFTPTDHDSHDHSPVASTIGLNELGSKNHSQLTGIGVNDHHNKFDSSDHASTDHTGIPGVGIQNPTLGILQQGALGAPGSYWICDVGPDLTGNKFARGIFHASIASTGQISYEIIWDGANGILFNAHQSNMGAAWTVSQGCAFVSPVTNGPVITMETHNLSSTHFDVQVSIVSNVFGVFIRVFHLWVAGNAHLGITHSWYSF